MTGLEIAFLLACVFPYTQIIPLASYNQPYALLFGGLIFLIRGARTLGEMRPLDRWALAGLLTVGSALFMVSTFPEPTGQDLKYLLNYLTPFLLTPAVVSIVQRDPEKVERVLRLGICAWFATAIIQQISPSFLTFLVGSFSETSEAAAGSGRGVLGLAPEPTHHGFHMLVLAAAYSLVSRRRWPIILCLVDALLLARSASVLLTLALGGITWCCLRPQRLVIPVTGAAVLIATGIGFFAFSPSADSRILTLIGLALENPGDLLMIDYSVNMRLGGMIASFVNSFGDHLLPHGLSHEHWLAARADIVRTTPWLMDLSTVGFPSGFGVLLYQGGWFVLPILLMIIARFIGGHRLGWPGAIVVSTIFVFLSQYYLATPDFSLAYGLLAARAMRRASATTLPKSTANAALLAPA